MSLFDLGNFTLHSGGSSKFRINCDALTGGDWAALALMLAERLPAFGDVYGVPRGGVKLATALRPCCRNDTGLVLVCDDVLTTGRSMEEARAQFEKAGREVAGAVVFARGPVVPDWVTPLFRMPPAPAEGA